MIKKATPSSKKKKVTSKRRRLYEEAIKDDPVDHNAGAPEEAQTHKAADSNDTTDSLKIKAMAADNTIKHYCFWSFSSALIPVPIVDLAAMSAIQLKMISEISDLYGVPFSENLAKKSVATLIASGSSSTFASLAKFVPGLGYIGVVIPLATINVSYTYAIGKIFVQHFQSGNDLETFDAEKNKTSFKEKLAEGKEYAKKAQQKFKKKAREKKSAKNN